MLEIQGAFGSIEGFPPRLVPFKQSANFFGLLDAALDGFQDPVDGLGIPAEYKIRIKMALEHILYLVRGMTDVNSVPPYADILGCLLHILREFHKGVRSMTKS